MSKDDRKYLYQQGDFDVFLTDGKRKIRAAYPTHRLAGDVKTKITWTWERLKEAMEYARADAASSYGGDWQLIIVDAENIPRPRHRTKGKMAEACDLIRAQLFDSPGKRFLADLKKGQSCRDGLEEKMALPANVPSNDELQHLRSTIG